MHEFTIRGDVVEERGKRREISFYNGFDILGDDGRELFAVRFLADGSLEISANLSVVGYGGRRLDNHIIVRPRDSSRVLIERTEYEES